jgi:SpoVK/Ycf46/Vps4 family AAA+-type ATPase
MSSRKIQSALAKSAVKNGALREQSIDDLLAEKTEAVRTSEILEYVRVEESIADVGGMAGVKDFLRKREHGFGQAAARYGLPAPKGILLLGPPGTGKSLLAKIAASMMHLALIRFDLGRVHGSLVGQSEQRMRRALAMAEAQAPCELWIDELDKMFGGASGAAGDGGVTQRVFGTFLTWMQDRAKPVFIVATANDISRLPPEFLRKGRFDEIFFVDLPGADERRDILDVLLRKYGRDPGALVTEALVAKLDRYTGAEIEYVIVEALHEAFHDEQRELAATDLEAAVANIVPVADQRRSEIDGLRGWGKANARPASE